MFRISCKSLALAAAIATMPLAASAAAIVAGGNVKLGVDDLGQLNI